MAAAGGQAAAYQAMQNLRLNSILSFDGERHLVQTVCCPFGPTVVLVACCSCCCGWVDDLVPTSGMVSAGLQAGRSESP